jgi:hypothetical protein
MEKQSKETIENFAAALRWAKDKALDAGKDTSDGGTCNLDAPTINLSGWSKADIQELNKQSGGLVGEKLSSRFWKGSYWLNIPLYGQGDQRTRMAKAAVDYLTSVNVPASVFYQMD